VSLGEWAVTPDTATVSAGELVIIRTDLAPGNYVLICNISEVENGQLESHYQLGMHAQLVVK
jgi:uncharacterized cupredoxin-like copper-binding protein